MEKVGIIAGTGFYDFPGLQDHSWSLIGTRYKDLEVLHGALSGIELFFVPRHGRAHDIPPHKVDFKANIEVFRVKKVDAVIGVNSVGSLRDEIKPGALVIPDDYISPFRVDTFHDHDAYHVAPRLDDNLRGKLISAGAGLVSAGLDVVDHGVYWQSLGPRLETRAEVKMIREHAHIVGMNMASEAVLCQEAGIPFANISTVDNMAHGLGEELDFEKIKQMASENSKKARQLLQKFLEEL